MRIAVLTLPLHTNYGGILQAYALQTVLERMGHEVKVLLPEKKRIHHPLLMPLVYSKRLFRKFILGKDISIIYTDFERSRQYTEKFIKKHIHSWPRTPDKLTNAFDAYVVGSDQIWRPKYTWYGIEESFLDFAENNNDVIKIAYAASFGTDEWEYSEEQTARCAELAKKFNAVSVREESGITLCREYLGVEAQHCLDPTLLLNAEDYMKLLLGFSRKEPLPERFIMQYILDFKPDSAETSKKLSDNLNMPLVKGNSRCEDPEAGGRETIQPPVENWLTLLSSCEYVITDSFHACVFSLIFSKPFTVIVNQSRGASRFESLFKMLGLISDEEKGKESYSFDKEAITKAQSKLKTLKEQSIAFLTSRCKEQNKYRDKKIKAKAI